MKLRLLSPQLREENFAELSASVDRVVAKFTRTLEV